jgi:hypothetical protein
VRKRSRHPKRAKPAASDQRPGEEVVQVNDAYDGGGPPPEEPTKDEQHPTGG